MALANDMRLGPYRILEPLGAGGMGEVYRALDSKLGREVAVKLLPQFLARDPQLISRFDREARILASLNHPKIAAIYGMEDFEGFRFIVLELVSGPTLAQKLAAGPLSIHDALRYADQIAEGLNAAHEKGIIHRDLKPSNVKLTEADAVKILDFGLAKGPILLPDESTLSGAAEETMAGTIMGTLSYMSPEQARGQHADTRTDIWSFGCVVFEMLSGERPFGGRSASDKIAAVLGRDPEWKLLPKETPDSIREMLRRCLRKDVGKRMGDIREARAAIDEVLAHGRRRSRVWRRGRAAALLSSILVVLVLLVFWISHRSGTPNASGQYLAVMPFKELNGDSQGQLLAVGLSEMVSGQLSKLPGVLVIPPAVLQSILASRTDLPAIANDLKANVILSVSLEHSTTQIRAIYSVLSVSGENRGTQIAGGMVTASSNDFFALGEPLVESLIRDLHLQSSNVLKEDRMSGLTSPAEKDRYLKALGYLQRYENQASVDNAIALLDELRLTVTNSPLIEVTLARAYLYKYELTRQQDWASRAIEFCRNASKMRPSIPEVHVTLGLLQTRTGHPTEGIVEFQRALDEQPNWPDATLGLAEAYEGAGRFSEAIQAYRRAIELQPGFWSGYNKLGTFYKRQGQFDRAREMYEQVIKLTPDNARAYYNLGVVLQMMNRGEGARDAYTRSIAIQPSGEAYSNLGTLEYSLGRYRQSAEANEKAVTLSPERSTIWANLGDAYRWAPGLREKSLPAYEQAIRLADKELRVNQKDPFIHTTLALCLAKTGKCAEARRHVRQAFELNPNDSDNMFQAAVVANICDNRQEALSWVQKAVLRHYPVSALMQEPELANIRQTREFQDALASSASLGGAEKH